MRLGRPLESHKGLAALSIYAYQPIRRFQLVGAFSVIVKSSQSFVPSSIAQAAPSWAAAWCECDV